MASAQTRRFIVIEGGAEARPRLLRLPRMVVGPSHTDPSAFIGYRIAEEDVRKALENHRRQPVFDLWSMVIGRLPPVNNIHKYDFVASQLANQSLSTAHAAFRGVNRPVGDDERGLDHVAFITKPTVHFRFAPDMACVAKPQELPGDVVLATYVKLDFPEGRPNPARRVAVPTGGTITHWELIEAEPHDRMLPVRSAERYRRRLW